MIEKSGGRIGGSRWWLPVAAFLAGMALHAIASAPRPQALAAGTRSSSIVATPAAPVGGALAPVTASADRDTSDIQLD